MDKTRRVSWYPPNRRIFEGNESSRDERGSFFCLFYGWVVRAHGNHNIVIKLYNFCNVQSLKILNIGVSCAFAVAILLCKRGM